MVFAVEIWFFFLKNNNQFFKLQEKYGAFEWIVDKYLKLQSVKEEFYSVIFLSHFLFNLLQSFYPPPSPYFVFVLTRYLKFSGCPVETSSKRDLLNETFSGIFAVIMVGMDRGKFYGVCVCVRVRVRVRVCVCVYGGRGGNTPCPQKKKSNSYYF